MTYFYQSFKGNMDGVGLPAPESLFGSVDAAVASAGVLLGLVDRYGPAVTLRELVGDGGCVAGEGAGVLREGGGLGRDGGVPGGDGGAPGGDGGALGGLDGADGWSGSHACTGAYCASAVVASLAVAAGPSPAHGVYLSDVLGTLSRYGLSRPWLAVGLRRHRELYTPRLLKRSARRPEGALA